MILAVTGATGFVGQAVLDEAAAQGIQIRALTRHPQSPRHGVEWVRGALDDRAALDLLVEGADAVIHIAGVVNAPDKAGFVAGNVTGTKNVVEAALAHGVARFVHVSSLSAREPQMSDYGASKLAGEEAVTDSELDWTVVRPPAIYGPRDTEMFEMFRMAARGIVALPCEGRFSLIHVNDLARLLLALVSSDRDVSRRVFEVDDGTEGGWSHRAFAGLLGEAVGRRPLIFTPPAFALRLAARADQLVRGAKAKLTSDRVGYMLHPDWTVIAERRPPPARWTPRIATRDGLRETAQWYRANGWLRGTKTSGRD